MQHYYGGKDLCDRLGIKNPTYLSRLIKEKKVPVYHKRRGTRDILYSNEALIMAWELEKVQQYRIKRAEKAERRRENRREARRVLKNMRTVA